MKIPGTIALCMVVFTGLAYGQGLLETEKIAGSKSRQIALGDGQARYGSAIWDNTSTYWAWWSGADTGYINLDWATLSPSGGLTDELVDGFTFSYGSNNMDPAGESFAVYYFDSCTGWGNLGVLEAGFLFTGLPAGMT